jgi:GT2 family glycosyltransferase
VLRALVTVAQSEPQIGLVGPVIYCSDRPETIWSAGNAIDWSTGAVRRLHADERDGHPNVPYQVDYVAGTALCIKREVIEAVGPMDPRYFFYFEETRWCLAAQGKGYRAVVVPAARIWHKVSATIGPDSPATTYYMTRNVFLFLASSLVGGRRLRILAATWQRELRTVLAHSLKPQYRHLRRHRDARVLALRDALLGRWGKMGPDVARVCYSDA